MVIPRVDEGKSESASGNRIARRPDGTDPYYLDSNIFFYAKIRDRKYGDACAHVLRQLVDGKLSGATSTLALVETSNALRKYGRSGDVPDEVGAIYSLGLTVHELLNVDVRLATELFQETRVNPYDCTHAAIMKRTGLRNILTADGHFKDIPGITRIDPLTLPKH